MAGVLRVLKLGTMLCAIWALAACTAENRIRVHAVHVSGDKMSGDAYLVQFPSGENWLVDTGFKHFTGTDLIPYLHEHQIKQIDTMLLTHAHRNHYGGAVAIAERFGVKKAYFNLPDKAPCDAEKWATGCNYEHVLAARAALEKLGVSVKEARADTLLYADNEHGVAFKVLYQFSGEHAPFPRLSVNDQSVIARLSIGETSMLFTGDAGPVIGKYLADQKSELGAAVLTLPHHGVEGTVPNAFVEQSNPRVAIVSNSRGHWEGERGARLRTLVDGMGIPVYVTGKDGDLLIEMTADGVHVNQTPVEINKVTSE